MKEEGRCSGYGRRQF